MVSSCYCFLHSPNLHTFNPWKLIKIYIIIIFNNLVGLCVSEFVCVCVCMKDAKTSERKKLEKSMGKSNIFKGKVNEGIAEG